MPNIEDVLREKTHKNDGLDLGQRVFYTLSDDKDLQNHRNTKAIALLVKVLHEKKQLSDGEVDELLLSMRLLAAFGSPPGFAGEAKSLTVPGVLPRHSP